MNHRTAPLHSAWLAFLALAALASGAQPVLTSADLPQGGQTYIRANALPPLLGDDIEAGGANMEWDFSSLEATGTTETPYYPMSAASLTTQFVFSSADHFTAFELPDLGFENPLPFSGATTYHEFGSSNYRIIGLGITTDIFDLPVVYEDEEELLPLPLTYGATLDGTSAFSVDLPGLLYYETDQVSSIEVDAWGTLLLPRGSYECLRVKRVFAAQDSINVSAAGTGFSIPREGVVYEWYAPGEGMPVLAVQAVFGVPATWTFKPGEEDVSSVTDVPATNIGLVGNPVRIGEDAVLSAPGHASLALSVCDAAGKVVYTGTAPVINGRCAVSTAYWEPGMYLISTQGQPVMRLMAH